jgi:hypothetical protein
VTVLVLLACGVVRLVAWCCTTSDVHRRSIVGRIRRAPGDDLVPAGLQPPVAG